MTAPLLVHVNGPESAVRATVLSALRDAGVSVSPAASPDAVVVSAAGTVDEALAGWASREYPVVVVADTVSADDARRAVRSGVKTMVRSNAGPNQLVAALHSARDGDGRLPHEVLVRLLGGTPEPPVSAPRIPTRLTPRQTAVLTLMADGHGNAAIAEALACSEHTVKNVIYDLMARLHVRNRAHAVALAVRTGLI
ncbi:response regulator transcription factor [Actinokineospora xionganensis]|uniref:response regulator transcription factor n=1 Tax=Actinokineospora xionganensis TaxID=2684470 RepID=UPI0028A74E56|nr:response regulator transcription factor [Actinokineospora xionganensis]